MKYRTVKRLTGVAYRRLTTIINTEAIATGMSNLIGIYINSSAPTLRNITATATAAIGSNVSWGLKIEGMSSETINIDHSTFEGTTNSISNATAIKLNIFSSKLVTGAPPEKGHCIGVVFLKDGVLSEVDAECKPITP